MCAVALARDPSAFCSTAHEPVATDLDERDGVCPDEDKHPPMPGQMKVNIWKDRLGITRTSGPGNAWYKSGQGQA